MTNVSSSALNALANLYLTRLLLEDDRDRMPKAEQHLDLNGASEALRELLKKKYGAAKIGEHSSLVNAWGVGLNIGFAIAAAILTHSLDEDACTESVKRALTAADLDYYLKSDAA